mmetsp:Transcript_2482/g.5921  ORF Transcript_2482/g.5921 Transcript_2482/m.5921 type:complete len:210 (-) Transcript_2482:4401-5030(-)
MSAARPVTVYGGEIFDEGELGGVQFLLLQLCRQLLLVCLCQVRSCQVHQLQLARLLEQHGQQPDKLAVPVQVVVAEVEAEKAADVARALEEAEQLLQLLVAYLAVLRVHQQRPQLLALLEDQLGEVGGRVMSLDEDGELEVGPAVVVGGDDGGVGPLLSTGEELRLGVDDDRLLHVLDPPLFPCAASEQQDPQQQAPDGARDSDLEEKV